MVQAYTFGARVLPLAAILFALSGAALAQDDTMIVGGKPAEDGDFPYQVRIYSVGNDDIGFCGGSVIDKEWVLTAAHCVMDVNEVMVGYGSIDRTQTTKIPSAKVIMHPDYLQGKATDVALIKLKAPIDDPKTIIKLADPETENSFVAPGAKLVVSGWGAQWEVQKDAAVMQLLSSVASGKQM
ncbi:MAG TPA: serine protease, partial [Methyloceanibacter sp.]|nr:serine protease [Methyloceanibacter sp.]